MITDIGSETKLVCKHCGSTVFHYNIRTDFTVHFDSLEDGKIDIIDRIPGTTYEFDTIYCNSCGKRAFSRRIMENEHDVVFPA